MAESVELNRQTTVEIDWSERKYDRVRVQVVEPDYFYPGRFPPHQVHQIRHGVKVIDLFRDEETGIMVSDIKKFERWITGQ